MTGKEVRLTLELIRHMTTSYLVFIKDPDLPLPPLHNLILAEEQVARGARVVVHGHPGWFERAMDEADSIQSYTIEAAEEEGS